MADVNYETIENPYNDYLERTPGDLGIGGPSTQQYQNPSQPSAGGAATSGQTGGTSTPAGNGSVEEQPVKTGGSLSDIWITNSIRSDNWKPKSVGFFLDGQTGYAEFTKVFISGNVTALSGNIGGFTITTNTISTTNLILDSLNERITLGSGDEVVVLDANDSYRMWAGNASSSLAPFSVSREGALKGTSGIIGGFTITATELYGGIIKTGLSVQQGTTGVVMDTSGLRGYDSVLGRTFNLPTDGSVPTFANGVINNTIFEIDTSAVLRTSDTVGDGSSASAGILINNTGIYATEDNQLLADANVKILIDGSAEIKMNIKGGQTDYNTGTGYFLGLSGGEYKFSIGNQTTNYMTYDGSYLRIKGSFDVGAGGLINNASYTVANLPVSPSTQGFSPPTAYE